MSFSTSTVIFQALIEIRSSESV